MPLFGVLALPLLLLLVRFALFNLLLLLLLFGLLATHRRSAFRYGVLGIHCAGIHNGALLHEVYARELVANVAVPALCQRVRFRPLRQSAVDVSCI